MINPDYSFHQMRSSLESDDSQNQDSQTDSDSFENQEEELGIKKYIDSLRLEIHTLVSNITDVESISHQNLPPLRELISNELESGYQKILENMESGIDEGNSTLIDVNEGALESQIIQWIENLKAHVKKEAIVDITDEELLNLEAQCWMLFDAIADVKNTETFRKGVKDYLKEDDLEVGDKKYNKAKKRCVKALAQEYGFSDVEMDILVDLVMLDGRKMDEYSLGLLVETIARLWKQYDIGSQKKDLAKVVMGHFLATGATSFAPSLFANLVPGGNFNLEAFLGYQGLRCSGDFITLRSAIVMEEVTMKINQEINKRITESLFFQEFEFIHEKSLGEIYSTLERGKAATQRLLTDAINQFAPIILGITLSLAFMTKINPILGGVGLAGLPVMYAIAKRNHQSIADLYQAEMEGSELITTAVAQVKEGIEEVRTSPDRKYVEKHVQGLMSERDELAKERGVKEKKLWWKMILPFDASAAIAGVIGAILNKAGALSGGEVLASIFYSERLNGPIDKLVNLYFDKFARAVQDIKRMEEILGDYESLDLPEGEKEKERISVKELSGFGISISDLHFKGILQGANLDIEEGEFVVVVGPSGSGKSTLLRAIAGLNIPERGHVKIGGVPIERVKKYGEESIYTEMSYCNQSPQIFEEFTLRENLVLWTQKQISDDEIKAVMKKLHLDKFIGMLDEKVKHLSGGEKVRIGVARTLLKGSKILLLDEPTASLDSTSAKEVRDVIRELASEKSGITVVCVTHDQELIDVGDRNVELEKINKGN